MGQGLSCRSSHEHGLFRAVQHGDLETVATLLETRPTLMHHTTVYDRHSALHIAAANGQIQILSRLLDGSVNPDVLNRQKQTPLMLAAMHGKIACVEKLLEAGANVLMFDTLHGRTCLHYAAFYGHSSCLKAILAAAQSSPVAASCAFKLVSEAWSLLSDKTKRLEYNQKRSSKGFQHNTPNHVGSQADAPSSNGFYNFKKDVNSNVRTGNNNARPPSTSVPPPHKRAETFWTICNRCGTHYEYLRIYLNHTLLCPNCNEAFVAVERGPPPNVFKPSNWSSRQQHQNSRHHAGSNNTNLQWGSHSRMAGFNSTDGSSSVAAQAASVVQQASEKVRREGVMSIAEWERSQMSKRTDGSSHKVEKPMKKRRTDDARINGNQGYGRLQPNRSKMEGWCGAAWIHV